MITWKLLSVLLSLLLLLSVPIFSDVVLTDQEAEELDQAFKTLDDLLETQNQELELAETQLAGAEQEIVKLEVSLKLVETSWREQRIEQTKKTIAWVMGSLFFGYLIGTALK